MSAVNVESSVPPNEVLKNTNQNSQRIIANMKEVINSNKKKSRNYYRRKKENEINFEPEITDISNVMNNSLTIVSPNVSVDEMNDCLTKSSSQVSSTNGVDRKKSKMTGKTETLKAKSPLKTVSIRNHFSPKPKQVHEKTLNAFEVMMTARNKVIGLNTSGKDSVVTVDDENSDDDTKASNAKRKLILEDWAARKGSFKRKLEDEAREEYITHEMQKRSKRFKDMLENGNSSVPQTVPKKRNLPKGSSKLSLRSEKSEKVVVERKTKLIKRKRVQVPKLVSSDEDNSEQLNSEDVEFVEKLSSPLKKRDSLLGYFSKVISPNSTQTNVDISVEPEIVMVKNVRNAKTNKTIGKRKQVKMEDRNSVNSDKVKSDTIEETNRSGRPKRSCTLNPRYDYDLDEIEHVEKSSSCKQNRKNSRKKIVSTEPVESDPKNIMKVIEIVDLETSVEEYFQECTKNVYTKKLAPIFMKSTPKPIVDPEVVKARQAFLMSGVPEKLKIELEKRKQFQQLFETSAQYFPRMSHIYQDEPEVTNSDATNLGKHKIKWRTETPFQTPEKRPCDVLRVNSDVIKWSPLKSLGLVKNKKAYIDKMKTQYENFHTNRCFNQLKKKYSSAKENINLDTHQISDSLVITRKRVQKKDLNADKNLPSSVNGDLLFTEKYKPMSFEEVVVNRTPFNELKEFLLSWKVENSIMKQHSSSSVSSLSLDVDYSSNSNNNFSSVVLCGPSSSGKTNAVFALANELNFNVLEINAGMKRTGKKLLQELHEATQSHQLDRDRNKQLFKQLLNGNKKETSSDDDSNSLLDSPNEKRSLVLVEDADIVFEQDAGFIEAIHQLVASSKRPVILTANNANCSHLTKLINQRAIDFSIPDALSISKFLSILSLIENCPIDLDNIGALYMHNKCNLRKTMLEMQFFIQSGGDRVQSKSKNNFSINFSKPLSPGSAMKIDSSLNVHRTLFDFFTNHQNISVKVPFPVDLNGLHNSLEGIFKKSKLVQDNLKTDKRTSVEKKSAKLLKCDDNMKELHRLCDFYDQISTVEYMMEKQRLHDQFSLSDEINHYLVEGTLQTHLETEQLPYNLTSKDSERSPISQQILLNSLRSNRSVALDYEPCLRSICRNEKSRLLDDRRGSRFYHYLRNMCVNSISFSMKFFDQYCPILQDTLNDQSPNDINKEPV